MKKYGTLYEFAFIHSCIEHLVNYFHICFDLTENYETKDKWNYSLPGTLAGKFSPGVLVNNSEIAVYVN